MPKYTNISKGQSCTIPAGFDKCTVILSGGSTTASYNAITVASSTTLSSGALPTRGGNNQALFSLGKKSATVTNNNGDSIDVHYE